MDESVLGEVQGGPDLLAWFGGRAPSFHDAEVLSLELDRAGAICRLRVHAFEITNAVDQAGYCVLARHAVVSFELGDVTELKLDGFNHQNVLGGLSIERATNGYRVELEPCWGLSGFLMTRTIQIAVSPGAPPKVTSSGIQPSQPGQLP